MKQTDLFFSPVIDLRYHTLPAHVMDALHAVYSACRAVNQPQKYGPAIEVIIIDAVHQDYDSKFHKPTISYDSGKKVLEAAVKVDLENLLASPFPEAVEIYKELIFQVLDQVHRERSRTLENYDFERLKQDLLGAIREEAGVLE